MINLIKRLFEKFEKSMVCSIIKIGAFINSIDYNAHSDIQLKDNNVNTSLDIDFLKLLIENMDLLYKYKSVDDIKNNLNEGFKDAEQDSYFYHDKKYNLFYSIVKLDNKVLLCFRGTLKTSLKNLAIDIFDKKIPADNGEVHDGFYISWNEVKDKIIENLTEIKNNNLNSPLEIIIFGHSLGGAISTLAAYDLGLKYNISIGLKDNISIGSVWTFGSPRVGNKDFAKYYTENKTWSDYRFTYSKDPITHLPPISWDFHHVGIEYYLNPTQMTYKILDDLESKEGNNQFSLCEDNILKNVKDHNGYFKIDYTKLTKY